MQTWSTLKHSRKWGRCAARGVGVETSSRSNTSRRGCRSLRHSRLTRISHWSTALNIPCPAHVDDEEHPDYERWLTQLFAPGTSLGGARPKASVRDEEGVLCLAKFPSRQDRRDVGAWELVAHRLGARAGINVPHTRALRVPGSAYTTFLARRFD